MSQMVQQSLAKHFTTCTHHSELPLLDCLRHEINAYDILDAPHKELTIHNIPVSHEARVFSYLAWQVMTRGLRQSHWLTDHHNVQLHVKGQVTGMPWHRPPSRSPPVTPSHWLADVPAWWRLMPTCGEAHSTIAKLGIPCFILALCNTSSAKYRIKCGKFRDLQIVYSL